MNEARSYIESLPIKTKCGIGSHKRIAKALADVGLFDHDRKRYLVPEQFYNWSTKKHMVRAAITEESLQRFFNAYRDQQSVQGQTPVWPPIGRRGRYSVAECPR